MKTYQSESTETTGSLFFPHLKSQWVFPVTGSSPLDEIEGPRSLPRCCSLSRHMVSTVAMGLLPSPSQPQQMWKWTSRVSNGRTFNAKSVHFTAAIIQPSVPSISDQNSHSRFDHPGLEWVAWTNERNGLFPECLCLQGYLTKHSKSHLDTKYC